jgi:hypothetical protein
MKEDLGMDAFIKVILENLMKDRAQVHQSQHSECLIH